MHVLDLFKHESTFQQMPISDRLLATGYVILLGMGITFLALVLILFLTKLMSKMIQSLENRRMPANQRPTPVAASKPERTQSPQAVPDDGQSHLGPQEDAHVAVIAAAIAMMGDTTGSFRVTRIRRIPDTATAWGQMGTVETIESRL